MILNPSMTIISFKKFIVCIPCEKAEFTGGFISIISSSENSFSVNLLILKRVIDFP